MQFEVIQYRLLHEYGAQCRWEPLSLYKACWVESDDAEALENFKKRKYQFMAKGPRRPRRVPRRLGIRVADGPERFPQNPFPLHFGILASRQAQPFAHMRQYPYICRQDHSHRNNLSQTDMQEKIIILDFGSQTTQLIGRRVRELDTYCEILPYNKFPHGDESIKGVILSGSPFSVYDSKAFKIDLSEIRGKYPILGICYGAQLWHTAMEVK